MQGLITDINLKRNILDKFINTFVKNDYTFRISSTGGGGRKLMWCHFKEECKVFSTEQLFQSQLQIVSPLFFYSERTEELFLTDFEDVCNFINNLEPWDEVDAEIFDENLEWVIAVTHEDVSMVSGLKITIDEYDYEKDMAQD